MYIDIKNKGVILMNNISITIEVPAHDAIWLSKLLALVNESKENIPHEKRESAKAKIKEIKESIEKYDLFFDFYSPSSK